MPRLTDKARESIEAERVAVKAAEDAAREKRESAFRAEFIEPKLLDESLRKEAAAAGEFAAKSFSGKGMALTEVSIRYTYDPTTGERIYKQPPAPLGINADRQFSGRGLKQRSPEQLAQANAFGIQFAQEFQVIAENDPFFERNEQLRFDRELSEFKAQLAQEHSVGQPGVQKVETGAIIKGPSARRRASGDRTGISGRRQQQTGLRQTGLGIL